MAVHKSNEANFDPFRPPPPIPPHPLIFSCAANFGQKWLSNISALTPPPGGHAICRQPVIGWMIMKMRRKMYNQRLQNQ